MNQKIKVAVMFGGRSGEHEVSLVSAKSVIKALNPNKYEIITLGITKNGSWIYDVNPEDMKVLNKKPYAGPKGLTDLLASKPDVVFPVMHGTFSEDGTIQGLLEIMGLPYVGCGVMASAAGMDKTIAKKLFADAGLEIVPYLELKRSLIQNNIDAAIKETEAALPYPCFVKPVNSGSSVGISKAKDRKSLAEALKTAAEFDRKILIEQAIKGREIEVSVLGNEEPTASLPGEVIPCNEFYDYSAKYIDNKSGLKIPADLDVSLRDEIRSNAVKAYKAIDGSGMARVDFFIENDTNRIFINEINTIPGFTGISMYPKLWEATGLEYSKLLDKLIELAIERFEDREKSLKAIEALNSNI